ncbi:metal ABC transporter permease [Methylobacterium sp. NEAU K]|uniref:metal ABC transporter permease n=1 Tax=Methylobacterium sp. NEAU K TaxID=3064946 RepID=UPI002734BCCD|nr:metal ABC transporter permease [Methylobacterium sp. NEAU K]MDP4002109.1 metal ABC transporter permease [Methylobacterium sp. NEAU K]
MSRIPTLALASLLTFVAGAQAAPQVERLRGTIEAVEGGGFTLKTLDGKTERVALAPDAKISWVVPAQLDQIKDGVFIGTATKGEPPVALEVVLFPEAMRGTGEGHYDWDAIPDRTAGGSRVKSAMTNGTVTTEQPSTAPDAPRVRSAMTNGTVTSSGSGAERTLTVDYGKGQSIQILVPPQAPVVTFEAADTGAISAGAKAFVVAARADDGTITARRVAVGKDGLTPPM